MSVESEVQTLLLADATLTAICSTRIFISGTVGKDGITAETTPTVYDASGTLLPCILIRERDVVSNGQVIDYNTREESVVQAFELYFYDESNYVNIDAMRTRTRYLLFGGILTGSFDLEHLLDIPRLIDQGALAGASMARQDWSVNSIL